MALGTREDVSLRETVGTCPSGGLRDMDSRIGSLSLSLCVAAAPAPLHTGS